jgi:hypothetical protein
MMHTLQATDIFDAAKELFGIELVGFFFAC